MSTENKTKINQLLSVTPRGVVLLSAWLKSQGYSLELIRSYKKSGWLEALGNGAVIRAGDHVDCYGALYSLQTQANMNIHIGGRTAFTLLGKSHYLELNAKKLILFGLQGNRLPIWFKKYDWKIDIEYHSSSFLPSEIGLVQLRVKEFTIKISGEIRALLECLYLVPQHQELTECYELIEFMNNVHPKKVQELLEYCTSVKVKRLFLYLAERVKHEWFNYLDVSRIDLGRGKRSIVQNGILDKKYQITVPREWSDNGR